MRELTVGEIEAVAGGVDQSTAIGGNLAIVGIGVGVIAAGVTAPVWFPLALIGVSVALTASYLLGS